MSSSATEILETTLVQTRSAIKSYQASKAAQNESTTRSTLPVEGKYGPYFSPVEEPFEMKRIVGESVSLEGGVAAILMQIAHPEVEKGVARHSDFTYRRIERARRSVIYIYCMIFGTPEEKRRVTDATHRAHTHVKGDGYDANDINAQLWVAATIYWSMVESVFGILDDERAEKVYEEFSVMATALRVPPEEWLKNREAFKVYCDGEVSRSEVTDEAKAVAKDVLDKKELPWGLTWAYATLKGPLSRPVTIEMLPEKVRNDFGIPSPWTRQVFWLVTSINAAIVPYLPIALREIPKNYYMADLRKRIASGSRL